MRRTYHHGDLRKALLDATLVIIRRDGPAAVTLRDVATRAGVSEAAPYHHFESKSHLLIEAAAQGYAALGVRLAAAAAEGPARERLIAMGAAYVQFALDEPGYFRLLFGAHIVELVAHPAAEAAKHAGHVAAMQLRDGVKAFAAEAPAAMRARDIERVVWAQIHGLAWLVLEQELRPQPSPAETVALARQGIASLLAGISPLRPRRRTSSRLRSARPA